MKIIFSRKGFDSENGGIPSPIFPDGTMLSMPIPSKEDHIGYNQLVVPNISKTYWQVLRELLGNKKLREGKLKIPLDNRKNYPCHFDPDLRKESLSGREKGWLPSLGQIGSAQGHLRNQDIQGGDLFLFFGWYQFIEFRNGKLCYKKDARYVGGFHIFFGYLEIGNILDHQAIKTHTPSWLKYHPHYRLPRRRENERNTIYVSTPKLSWNTHIPGGGMFKFHKDLILTRENQNRTEWNLDPKTFKGLEITCHPDAWANGRFKVANKGQEFVVHADKKAIK
jgi:hypothetical protein